MRPLWDDIWLDVATVVAKRSLCSRAQVGAVLVNAHQRIVSTGYNGPPRSFNHRDLPCTEWCVRAMDDDHGPSYGNCPSLHAEANAIMAADRSMWQNGALYVTGAICADCAKLVGNSGIARVIIGAEDVDRSYRHSEGSYEFLRSLGITVEVLQRSTQ